MQVQLLQLDGKLPNIALMRVAAHHRELGDEVTLRRAPTVRSVHPDLYERPDRVYASLLFERTRPVAEALLGARPDAIVGGTGWAVAGRLEDHGISTLEQDYSLYPRFRQSLGFSQRGCRLRCPFCVVPQKEGAMRGEQPIARIWRGDPWPKEILLLDNDFFGQPDWRARIEEIREGGYKVSFTQGINARFLDAETATAIASIKFRDDAMTRSQIYTAWDNRKDERRLFRGLQHLVDAGVRPYQIMVYMLIGYWPGETHEDREERRIKLREFGAVPYPMPYHRTPELVAYQRWVVAGAYDKTVPWAQFWGRARGEPRRLDLRPTLQLPLLPS